RAERACGGEGDVHTRMGDLSSGSSGRSAMSCSSDDSPGSTPKKKEVKGDIRAMVAFFLAVAGIGLAFLPRKMGAGLVLLCAFAALCMLMLLNSKIDQDVRTGVAAIT